MSRFEQAHPESHTTLASESYTQSENGITKQYCLNANVI